MRDQDIQLYIPLNIEREDIGTEESGGIVVDRCTHESISKFEKGLSSYAYL